MDYIGPDGVRRTHQSILKFPEPGEGPFVFEEGDEHTEEWIATVQHVIDTPPPISYAQIRFVLEHLQATGHHIVKASWMTRDEALTVDQAEALFHLQGG